jgi:3'-phosphoadenosine 5'-phosphosulfate (PAPS) 3'-phosphatase
MRWDACATEALVCAAGGACTEANGAHFDYAREALLNDGGLVASNGRLHERLVKALSENLPSY